MSQYLRPVSDISTTGWTGSTGSYIYTCLDEEPYSDSDYVQGGMNRPLIEGLSAPEGTPASGAGTLRFRAKRGVTVTVTPSILVGSTVIKAGSAITPTSSYAEYTLALSVAEMATLASTGDGWNDVRVRFVVGDVASSIYVSWVRFDVPDAVIPAGLEMGVMF